MKKKPRFSILSKVILLSGALTLFITAAALVVDSIISYQRQKASFTENCITTCDFVEIEFVDELKANKLNDGNESATHLFDTLIEKYETVADSYFTLTDEEVDAYIKDTNGALYGVKGMIGLSVEQAHRNTFYNAFFENVLQINAAYDINYATVVVFDGVREQTISLFDSFLNKFDYPSGHVTKTTGADLSFFKSGTQQSVLINESSIRIASNIMPFENNQNYVIYTMCYMSIEEFNETTTHNIITELLICLGVAIVLMVIYAILAKKFIIEGIEKVSKSSQQFVQKIQNDEPLEVVETTIKSNDEVGDLNRNILIMQQQMITYVHNIEEVTSKEEKINAELQVASKIQLESLPDKAYLNKNIELRAFIQPAKEVGGDFYDYFLIDDKHLALVIADVSGKGVPASLFMMKAKESIRTISLFEDDLARVFFEVNNKLCLNNQESYFVTAFLGVLDLETYEMKFISAGHERPFIISNGEVKQLQVKSNFVLGLEEDFVYEPETIKLEIGDKIFLHTDGLNEAINSKNEEFGYENISKALLACKETRTTLKNVQDRLSEFVGDNDPFDDITMILVDIKKDILSIHYKNPDYSAIEEASDKVSVYLDDYPMEISAKIGVIIDEIMNNIISYSRVSGDKIVDIIVEKMGEDVLTYFIDNGHPFNPLERPVKTVQENMDNDIVGGLGVSIVKQISKDVEYIYSDKKNILIVKM